MFKILRARMNTRTHILQQASINGSSPHAACISSPDDSDHHGYMTDQKAMEQELSARRFIRTTINTCCSAGEPTDLR